jgi:carbon monoxide dehydrogenase subunit G
MEIEKKMTIPAAREHVWKMLLDPHVMGACVPGMESIDVISDTEYLVNIFVKMSFVSARFKIRTVIVDTTVPAYLKCQGTGEDSAVTSSLKHTSEVFLTEIGPAQTELVTKVNVELLGRLGSFGMNMMKTKADRMWDDFGKNLSERILAGTAAAPGAPAEAASPGPDKEHPAAAPSLVSRMKSVFGSPSK